jgi:uncharacterized lipoprotein YddW (UPF0748 family)
MPSLRPLYVSCLTLLILLASRPIVDDGYGAPAGSAQAVSIVTPAKVALRQKGEAKLVRETTQTLTTLLAELAVGAETIDEQALADGGLGRCRVVILPYNPTLRNEHVAALTKFIESGGKVLACYQLNAQLGEALGFGHAKYMRQAHRGQFAEMRFDAADIHGLPKAVHQKSWNITVAEPTGHNARVIGRWFDDAGRATEYPALLVSDRGAFFSHIVLRDDREGKKRLLAALLGRLAPPLWKPIAQRELEQAGRVGHCRSEEEVAAYVKKAAGGDPHIARARQALQRARQQFAQGDYAETVESVETAHEMLVQSYLRAADSPRREARAVWNHSGLGAYPGDWERSMKLLAAGGINLVLPNMLWGGLAHYPSDLLPPSFAVRRYGDQLEQCCRAAKKYGIEVHVWKVHYNLYGASREFVEKMRREGRTQVNAEGQPSDWLCPSHPENQKLELESMLEVARKYPVDGLHFDYIRYPDGAHCYCDGCRRRFETQSGRPVSDWPKECLSGARKEEYREWRRRQITLLVAAVSHQARKIRPGLKLSAAVFGRYPDCRESVAQDWPKWVKAGYLDFVCPMDYTTNDQEFIALVRNQMKLIEGRVPLYPGIGATASNSLLAPDRVVGQIVHARALGAAGFTIFNFDADTAASIVPAVGLGAGVHHAVPPHQSP